VIVYNNENRRNTMRGVFLTAGLAVLSGCTTLGEITATKQGCGYIGCETGGLVVYPHEEYSAITLPRRWYGVNGELPSDYPPGSEERRNLRTQQIEKLRSMGLDPQGRPLYGP